MPKRSDSGAARFDLGQQAPGVDAHDAGARDQLVALHRDRAADHQRRGDACPTLIVEARLERRVGRQLQPIERLQALLAIDHDLTAADQRFAQQDRGAFAHPAETRVLRGVIEWQNDDRRALRGLRADHRRRREQRPPSGTRAGAPVSCGVDGFERPRAADRNGEMAIALVVVRARVLAGVIGEDELTDGEVRDAVAGLLDAFLDDLVAGAFFMALGGLVVAAAAAALDPEDVERPTERLRQRITRRPRTTWGLALRGVAALALGVFVVINPTVTLQVVAIIGGAYLIFFGTSELLVLLQRGGVSTVEALTTAGLRGGRCRRGGVRGGGDRRDPGDHRAR